MEQDVVTMATSGTNQIERWPAELEAGGETSTR